jgi:hypothetical protein
VNLNDFCLPRVSRAFGGHTSFVLCADKVLSELPAVGFFFDFLWMVGLQVSFFSSDNRIG